MYRRPADVQCLSHVSFVQLLARNEQHFQDAVLDHAVYILPRVLGCLPAQYSVTMQLRQEALLHRRRMLRCTH